MGSSTPYERDPPQYASERLEDPPRAFGDLALGFLNLALVSNDVPQPFRPGRVKFVLGTYHSPPSLARV